VLNEEDDEDGELCDLIDRLEIDCATCFNCRTQTKENVKFKNLYKQLIEDIVRSLA
jgi:hypothetical protein